ncbi:MAG: hypothetical protein IKF05_02570, partial [Erysipelotrichaceae bacterium]|nr:hypothetical protein [Erysipelotrichaceae bacterium]
TTPFTHPQDAVIYELHVRDFTSDTTLPKSKRGKLKGLIEKGMRLEEHTVGFDYLKELGFTHLQLLPVFDFKTVNEEDSKEYNWGYDPEQYNVVEGSYVDINDSYSRINDLAEAVAEFHAAGIRVTLDVVFNQSMTARTSLCRNFYRMPFSATTARANRQTVPSAAASVVRIRFSSVNISSICATVTSIFSISTVCVLTSWA